MVSGMVEPRVVPGASGPRAGVEVIEFVLADPHRRLRGVRLEQELGLAADDLDFGYDEASGRWVLRLPRPPVRRMEYRLQLRHADGGVETINDPAARGCAPGAFGPKSVLELPGYAAPAWLDSGVRWPVRAQLAVPTSTGPVDLTVLSPPWPSTRLLVAHDGPEYDRLAGLGVFAAAVVHEGRVPPFHLALAAPGERNERYSANPYYGDALATAVIPALHAELGTRGPVALMGASLGGLAALHAQRRHPAGIGGLFLQSGSFFVPEFDECESGFRFYQRIVRYVASVHRAPHAGEAPVPAVLTCGGIEENVRNNRLMTATLRYRGYPAKLHEVPDLHNFTAWRDAFDPHLVELLTAVWGAPEAGGRGGGAGEDCGAGDA
jgi:enterochelin esterase-like enzyme